MKIGFFDLEGWEENLIKKYFPNQEIYFSTEKLDEEHLPPDKDLEIISVFIDSKINSKVLDYFPKLKFITTRSVGFDHIDINACKKRNILVGYVPSYGDNTVAEFAFGLLLSLTRKIYPAINQIKEIESFSVKGLRGIDLKGKTLGVIGTGRIGKEMIKIANGFGMKVIAYDPYPDENAAKTLNYLYVNLPDLLRNSDVISIHCPYNKETHHLINKDNFNLIKRGAYLINTARGAIVETNALLLALESGVLAGAGLDVLEEEGEIKDELSLLSKENLKSNELFVMLQDHILMKMPNVLITPHNAFNSQEAIERILNTTNLNIESFMNNKPLNLIPEEAYDN